MDNPDFADAISQDVRGAVHYLNTYTQSIGVNGCCMGRALTLIALSAVPEFTAGVFWYGFPPLNRLDASGIKAQIQAHWATQDAFFPAASVDVPEGKFARSGVSAEFHRCLADHAFANETAVGDGRISDTQYDPVWAQLAWEGALTFFGRSCGSELVAVKRSP